MEARPGTFARERLTLGRLIHEMVRRDPAFRNHLRGPEGDSRIVMVLSRDPVSKLVGLLESLASPATVAILQPGPAIGDDRIPEIELLHVTRVSDEEGHDECGTHPNAEVGMFLEWIKKQGGTGCLHVAAPVDLLCELTRL